MPAPETAGSPDLCFITTCKGRLQHLRQTLPTMLAQPGTACVVVDYDCPDGTGDWVAANHPQVQLVRVAGRPTFEIARARNLGAQAATAPWLCFVDADALLAPNFAQQVLGLLRRGRYFQAFPRSHDATGTCICHRDDFAAVQGYDAVLQGYGTEDRDLYFRLELAGIAPATFPGGLVQMLKHGTALRTEHYAVKELKVNNTVNRVYCKIKWDLMRLRQVTLKPEWRVNLYAQVLKSVLDAKASGKAVSLQIPVSAVDTRDQGLFVTTLLYQVLPPGSEAAHAYTRRASAAAAARPVKTDA